MNLPVFINYNNEFTYQYLRNLFKYNVNRLLGTTQTSIVETTVNLDITEVNLYLL